MPDTTAAAQSLQGGGGAAATVRRGGRHASDGGADGRDAARSDPGERRVPARAAVRRLGRAGAAGRGSLAAPGQASRTRSRARCGPRRPGRPISRELQRGLRRVRRYEMLRLGRARARLGDDRRGRARAVRVRRRLPGRRGRRSATPSCARELGAPRGDDGAPVRFVVMAMGKLGGEELNFSSDIDVCYFYSTDAGRRGRAHPARVLRRAVAARVAPRWSRRPPTAWCSASTCACGPRGATGRCATRWPRPRRTTRRSAGRGSGRPGCGRARRPATSALGDELLAIAGAVHLSAQHRPAHGRRGARRCARCSAIRPTRPARSARPASTSSWGRAASATSRWSCRRCSSCTRGKRPDLRERNTPRALPRLVVAGLLSDREAWTLLAAYRFWRRLEHRVQVATGAQRHRLPGDDEARARFAGGLGFAEPGGASTPRWRRKRAAVEAIAATLGDPPAGLIDRGGAPARSDARPRRAGAPGGGRGVPRRRGRGRHAGGGRRAAAAGAARAGDRVARSGPRAAALSRAGLARGSGALLALLRDEPQLAAHAGRRCSVPATAGGAAGAAPACGTRSSTAWGPRAGRATRCCCGWIRPASGPGGGRRRSMYDDYEEGALRAVRRFQAEETAAHRPARRRRQPGRAGGRRRS